MYKEIDPKWFTKAGIIKSTAPKEIKLQNFLNKALLVHGDTYDYSAVDYTVATAKIDIICKVHGVFSQRATNHLAKGYGCPICAGNAKSNTSDFITKAKLIHKETYIYDKVDYVASNIHVLIGCSIHGYFSQEANSHLQGRGCPECAISTVANKRMLSADEFLTRSIRLHGDKYDYSKTIYRGCNSILNIVCKQHGEFSQTAGNHLSGHGCSICAGVNRRTTEEFISEASNRHNSFYSYSKTEYIGCDNKVLITCPDHGDFWQVAKKHLSGQKCPLCYKPNLTTRGLYILYSTTLQCYKIGITNNVGNRITRLRSQGETFALINFYDLNNNEHAMKLEKILHQHFKDKQCKEFLETDLDGKTELFNLNEEDIQYIDTYIKNYCKINNLVLG